MDEEPPPTRGSREKCLHMCRIGRSSEWRNLMPIKPLFHTRRALSSAQIQTLVFYRLWKWLTARVACWWRVSTIIEIIHSYLSPVNLLLSNYNRGVTESAWKVVENFFLRELTGNRRREDCGWYRIKEAERWSLFVSSSTSIQSVVIEGLNGLTWSTCGCLEMLFPAIRSDGKW